MGQLQIRIPDDLKERFNRVCERQYVNKSALIRGWVEEYLKNEEGEKMILFERPGIRIWTEEELVIIEDANERQEAPDTPENRERFISWAKELVDTWRKEQSVE
jgi:hypothetical protein